MGLKEILIKDFEESIIILEKRLGRHKGDLEVIREMDFDRATYLVKIKPLIGADDRVLASAEHEGTMEEAIRNAEAEYNVVAAGRDGDVNYSVVIMVRGNELRLPESFWKDKVELSKDLYARF